jgi:APA family basic amino acid/polyamine antiporter
VTDLAVYLVFVAVNATVIILRVRGPELRRPFRVPGAIGRVPVAPVLGLLSVIVMLTQLDTPALVLGSALCAIGLVAGWLFRRR